MGRNKALACGRAVPILLAGMIGYLIGGWQPTALRSQNLSAAESVALRFPQQWDAASPVASAAGLLPAAVTRDAAPTTAAAKADDAQLALFDPEPMVPQPAQPAVSPAPQYAAPAATVQLASAEVGTAVVFNARETREAPPHIGRAPAVAARHAVMNRPGYMLDDAQIASIRERLHLTPDQEQMWPAVEAALRNIAYTRARQAHGRGASSDTAQAADVDPNSVEGLKSAATPLILSFSEEQKEQVRSIAHVMGLDQLASQF
jgi:zinc resistance-associated protein